MNTIVIYVDSRFRASGTNASFTWQLRESLNMKSAQIRVDDIRITNTFFTVTPDNQFAYFSNVTNGLTLAPFPEEGTPNPLLAVKMPLGAYTAQDFATTLQTLSGRNISYDARTNSLSIDASENMQHLDDFALLSFPPLYFPSECTPTVPRSINNILRDYDLLMDENNNPIQRFNFINMSPYDALYLRSNRLACQGSYGPRQEHNILSNIPISGLAGEVIQHSNDDQEWMLLGDVSLRTMDFSLTDVHGDVVDTKGLPISFRLFLQG